MKVSRFCPTVGRFCATCPPRRVLAGLAGGAGLLDGSTRFRHSRAQVCGHCGTCTASRNEGGEVAGFVLVPSRDQATVGASAAEYSAVPRPLAFYCASD